MATRKNKRRTRNLRQEVEDRPDSECTSFVTLRVPIARLQQSSRFLSAFTNDQNSMKPRRKRSKSLTHSQTSRIHNRHTDADCPANEDGADESTSGANSPDMTLPSPSVSLAAVGAANAQTHLVSPGAQNVEAKPTDTGHHSTLRLKITARHLQRQATQKLRRRPARSTSSTSRSQNPQKRVSFALSNQENETPESSDNSFQGAVEEHSDPVDNGDLNMSGSPPPSKPERPTLKLSFSKPAIPQTSNAPAVQTPVPQSAVRTPSIKLKFGGSTPLGPSTPASASSVKRKKNPKDGDKSESVKKKQKRQSIVNESEDEISRPSPGPARPKIVFKNSQVQTSSKVAQTPAPIIKLKQKGKIPKRLPGVGYDSELEGREDDPVILEGFILRMQPGPDCDYLRKAVEDGTLGMLRTEKGPAISMKMLDHLGRRGILKIKDNTYATSLVDLPCIIEGMKSWDKKGWIKSIDISQMLLVLGRCSNEEEAKNYTLPPDVDEKTFQYAHGITAPMQWVRKRRFNKTKRARVDDIEAVERRVAQLLEQDKASVSVHYQILDHDPRGAVDENESGESDYDEDAEGEDDDVSGYFDNRNGHHTSYADTPRDLDAPAEADEEEIGDDELADLEGMFDEPVAAENSTKISSIAHNTHLAPEGGDSSFAVTSTSASPNVTAAQTPASALDHSSDEDDDEDDDDHDGNDEDIDDAQKEEDEEVRNARERVADFAAKIKEQEKNLTNYDTVVLRKKIQRTIEGLKADMVMWKRRAGIPLDDDEE